MRERTNDGEWVKPPTVAALAALPIFAVPQPPSVARPTSEAAADFQFAHGTAQWVRVQALRLYASRDQGYTDAELQEALGLDDSNKARPRRWELEQQALIRRDERVKRIVRGHLPACPYIITEKGVRVLRGSTAWPWAAKRRTP